MIHHAGQVTVPAAMRYLVDADAFEPTKHVGLPGPVADHPIHHHSTSLVEDRIDESHAQSRNPRLT